MKAVRFPLPIACTLLTFLLLAGSSPSADSQVVPAASGSSPASLSKSAATSASGQSAHPVIGPNISLESSTQHSSVTGWYSLLTPTLSYRFNPHISLNASVPYYLTDQNYVPVKSGGTTTYELKRKDSLLGDTSVSGQYAGNWSDFSATLTATGAFPTGDSRFGLSANTPTYNVTGHAEYSLGWFTPDIEVGQGNSSNLTHRALKKGYTAVGPLANFQAGASIDLPKNISFESDAYEDLPIGNQNIYGTVTRINKKGKTVTRQVLEGTGVAEDNGINTELDIDLPAHLQLEATYERSFIQATDTVGIGLTWTARVAK